MSRKRKLQDDDRVNSNHEDTIKELFNSEILDSTNICNDTEAAILFIKNTLIPTQEVKYPFPPVVFVHQLYDVIQNRTTVNRQIEALRNGKKIIIIHLGNDERMKVVVLFEDLRNHILEQLNVAEKLVFKKFFEKVMMGTTDIGISKIDMLIKHRFSERDVRKLVSEGLLILKDTGIFWFSFPSAGIFMKKLLRGRQTLLNIIKKRKYREILQRDIEEFPFKKSLELPIRYHVHDLAGGNFVKSFKTPSGRIFRFEK